MRIGAHLSISGGIAKAVERAKLLKCETLQIFSQNPRGWKGNPFDPEDVEQSIKLRNSYGIYPLIVHTPYLVNLASPDKRLFDKSIQILREALQKCAILNGDYVVTHIGSSRDKDRNWGIARIADAINKAFNKFNENVTLLLENTAGAGSHIGVNFIEFSRIFSKIENKEKLGICLDTCHAFVAGYDIKTVEGLKICMDEIDNFIGLDKLKVIHANDSKSKCGSHIDRHEHISRGFIGLEGFKNIFAYPYPGNLPVILETPKQSPSDDIRNIRILKNIRKDVLS